MAGQGLGRRARGQCSTGAGLLFGRRRALEAAAGLGAQQCQHARRHRATHLKVGKGLPGRPSGKESACQRRGHRFHPWSGKTPHAEGQRSPCATTAEPRAEPVLPDRGAAAIRGPQSNQGGALRHPRPSAAKHTETKTPKVSFLSMLQSQVFIRPHPHQKNPQKPYTQIQFHTDETRSGNSSPGEAVRKVAP